jgi:hypothetical protein
MFRTAGRLLPINLRTPDGMTIKIVRINSSQTAGSRSASINAGNLNSRFPVPAWSTAKVASMCAFSAAVRKLAESTLFGSHNRTATATRMLNAPTETNIIRQPSKDECSEPCWPANEIKPPMTEIC